MAKFSTYGQTFDVGDPYAEGHVLNAAEAASLNQLRAELISHRIRSGPFADVEKGQTPTPEQMAEANKLLATLTGSGDGAFAFGLRSAGGGAPRVTDPVEREALAIARGAVKAAAAKKNLKIAKKGEAPKDGEISFELYEQRVAETAKLPQVVEKAKKVVKAKSGGADAEAEIAF